jgi:hypothetical protein
MVEDLGKGVLLTRCRDTVELPRTTVLLLTVSSNTVQLVMRIRLPLELVHATTLGRRRVMLHTAARESTLARYLAPSPSPTMMGKIHPILTPQTLTNQS